jgi:poly-gamma-glutamate capsule biosynthesis protein CapA/YwtB (metallophosphatase superfamily)
MPRPRYPLPSLVQVVISVLSVFAAGLLRAGPAAAQHADSGGTFTMALTGDAIITRRLSVFDEPAYLGMIDRIRGADVAFTNLEILLHDYEPAPAYQSGGTWMRGDPEMAEELVWAGFDMVSMANNHTGDYGADGMRLTRKYAEASGLVTAGAGENLYEAREARFLETASGRVALISVASTFTAHSVAGKPKGAVRGRPGLNPLRHSQSRVLTRDQLESLRAGLAGAGINVPASGDRLRAFGESFEVGEEAGVRTEPDSADLAEISAVVRNAAGLADYVIVTIHAHERGRSNGEPADFVVSFAHAMIDAGAHVVTGHGPHVLRGIEIYRGRPIFYSLGDFVFQNETLLRLPFDNYASYELGENQHVSDFNDARYSNDTRGFPAQPEIWEAVIAYPRWENGQLAGIELEPITLGHGLPRSVRGRPVPADAELGRKIIGDLIERSGRFGTTIEWRDGIGIVRVR